MRAMFGLTFDIGGSVQSLPGRSGLGQFSGLVLRGWRLVG